MTTDIISIETMDFGDKQEQVVSAKSLFEFLELNKKHYARWIDKVIIKNAFAFEGQDYILQLPIDGLSTSDIFITIDFAKSISMMSKSKKGSEVRQYFINIEKAYKKTVGVVKQMSTLEMLKQAIVEIETRDTQIQKLETSNRQLNDTNARIFEMKAKDTKTGLKVLMDNIGAEINNAVFKKYNEQCPGDHSAMHRAAWNDYFRETNILYRGAKTASLKSKKDFLSWLNHGIAE